MPDDLQQPIERPAISRVSWFLPLLVLAAYAPLISAGYIWDDPAYVTENECLKTSSGLWDIWFLPGATPQYYPLVFTTFWTEYQFWKLHPLGYHFDNVLLHGINALLLYRVLLMLRVPGALLAAAIFAVHPVHVESVAWITERKNVLSGLFYLLSFQAYWRFATTDVTAESRSPWRWYAWALVCFLGALLSKSVTSSLPAAMLVVLWWKQGRLSWRQVLPLAPFFVLGVAAGLHTAYLEAHHVGAEGGEWNWTFWERCLIAGRAVWFYAVKIVWPWPLVFIYPKWKIVASEWWQALAPLSAVILLVGLWWGRGRWGRGPLAAALFFGGTLFPALGFVNVYPMRFSFVADHFQYLASIGVITLLAAAAVLLAQRWKLAWKPSLLAANLVLVIFGSISFGRCFAYRNVETLWVATLADNPDCWIAQYHLARVRFEQRRYWEAIELYQKVLKQRLEGEPDPGEMSQLYAWLADCYLSVGDPQSARRQHLAELDCFRRMIDDPFHEQMAVHYNIAALQAKLGQNEPAIASFRRVLELDPENADAHLDLGELLLRVKKFDEGAACFEKVVRSHPRNARAHYNLGVARFNLGDRAQARQHLEDALRIEPGFRPARLLLDQVATESLTPGSP